MKAANHPHGASVSASTLYNEINMPNPTRAQRRESWKQRTSATASALRSAGATVSRTGGRSVPTAATVVRPGQTESEIVKQAEAAMGESFVYVKPKTPLELAREAKQQKATGQPTARQIILDRQRIDSARIARERKPITSAPAFYGVPTPYRPGTTTAEVAAIRRGESWSTALPKDNTRSNMKRAIKRGYPGVDIKNLTDFQITVLYENVRAGLAQKKNGKKPKEPEALDIKLSEEVLDFERWFRNKSKDIRAVQVPFGEEGPVAYLRESIAQTSEMMGGVPAAIEKIVRAPEKVPEFAKIGAHGMTVGVAEQFKDDPIQTLSNIAVTAALFKGAGKVKTGVTGGVTSVTRGKIAASAIIEETVLTGKAKFPTTGKAGVTPDAAITQFIKSEKNIRTAIEAGKVEPPIAAKLTGSSKKFLDDVKKIDGEFSGWHATQKGFPKQTAAQAGSSSTPGLHIAPSVSPHFLGVGGETAVFGFGKKGKPTAISIEVVDFQRIPYTSRTTNKNMNKFLMETNEATGSRGIAYITTKFETLSKKASVEYEAVLPPGTPITRVGKTLETTWQGKKITVEQYKTVFSDSIKTDLKNITTLERLYSERAGKKVLVTPYDVLVASSAGVRSSVSKSKKYSSAFASSASSSVSSIRSGVRSDRTIESRPSKPDPELIPSATYSRTYSSSVISHIKSIERGISAPLVIRPLLGVPRPRRKTPDGEEKKKRKLKKVNIGDWFVRNPVPTLESLIGIK